MRVRRTLAALLAPPFLLSACGDSSSVADPPVSSHITSSAPTTQPPAHESPEHFIRRWAAAERRMENTGKTGAYLVISKPCESCQQLASDVSRFYASGGFVKWAGWQIVSIKHYSGKGTHHSYAMRARAASTVYKESGSGPQKHLSGGLATDLITLVRTSDAWHVVRFTKLGSD
jgi:hypothetical protein